MSRRAAFVSPPPLHQHVEDLSLAVHGAPEPEPLASNPDNHLVQMPDRARPCSAPPELASETRTELQHPAPDRLVRDVQPALGEKVLDIPEAEREPEIQPDGVSDDLGREPVATVGRALHPVTIPLTTGWRTPQCDIAAL